MRASSGGPGRSLAAKLTRAGAAVLLLAVVAGCAEPQPWVKPYEREHFADVVMSADRNPGVTTYLEHVYESREGARGATGTVGGGCGCN
jgi:hypothetical protein